MSFTDILLSLTKVYYRVQYKRVYVRDRTGTTTRRTNAMGEEIDCVGAGFTNGSRIRAGKTVGIKTVGYAGVEVAIGAYRDTEGCVQIHRGAAGRTLGGVESIEATTAGTSDSMEHVIRGVKGDEDGSRFQAD